MFRIRRLVAQLEVSDTGSYFVSFCFIMSLEVLKRKSTRMTTDTDVRVSVFGCECCFVCTHIIFVWLRLTKGRNRDAVCIPKVSNGLKYDGKKNVLSPIMLSFYLRARSLTLSHTLSQSLLVFPVCCARWSNKIIHRWQRWRPQFRIMNLLCILCVSDVYSADKRFHIDNDEWVTV